MKKDDSIYRVKVAFSDSDADFLGQIRVARLCDRMQAAATEHARLLGVGMDEMKKNGHTWMLLKMSLVFLKTVPLHEELLLLTWPSGIRGKTVSFRDFILQNATGETVAEATTDWVLVDLRTRRLVRLASAILALANENARRVDVAPPEKITSSFISGEVACSIPVRRADIDVNRHVNNIHYVEWLFEPLPEESLRRSLLRLDIEYRQEAVYGQTILSEAQWIDDSRTLHTLAQSDGTCLTKATCLWGDLQ